MHPSESKSVVESANHRRSIRNYTGDPIPTAAIHELLQIAGRAPSAWNIQPWRFHVVVDSDLKQKLQAAAYGQPQVGSAAAVIVLASDMEDALTRLAETRAPGMPADKQAAEVGSVSGYFAKLSIEERASWGRNQTNIALGYLLLALESLGYGSSPMLGFEAPKVRELLSLPDHVEIPALVAIGLPADEGFASERLPDSVISFLH